MQSKAHSLSRPIIYAKKKQKSRLIFNPITLLFYARFFVKHLSTITTYCLLKHIKLLYSNSMVLLSAVSESFY